MLSTVTLAATGAFIPVWIGSTLGMVVSDGLAIMVGKLLGKKLPERMVKIGAGVIFLGFGVFSMIQGGIKLPLYAWAIAVLLIGVLAVLFFRSPKKVAGIEEFSKEAASMEMN